MSKQLSQEIWKFPKFYGNSQIIWEFPKILGLPKFFGKIPKFFGKSLRVATTNGEHHNSKSFGIY